LHYAPHTFSYYVSGSFFKPAAEPWAPDGFLGESTPVPTVNPFVANGSVTWH
jgi:hypothetical protein